MTNEVQVESVAKPTNKKTKLVLSLVFDAIGVLSYFLPGLGETTDLIWAPISGLLLASMYKGTAGKVAAVFGTVEELIPFVDIIPTFTLTWIYTYIIKKEK